LHRQSINSTFNQVKKPPQPGFTIAAATTHLEEAHPLQALTVPLLGQSTAVQQAVHITVAVWLSLQGEGV
jgi:hypothetical protein